MKDHVIILFSAITACSASMAAACPDSASCAISSGTSNCVCPKGYKLVGSSCEGEFDDNYN